MGFVFLAIACLTTLPEPAIGQKIPPSLDPATVAGQKARVNVHEAFKCYTGRDYYTTEKEARLLLEMPDSKGNPDAFSVQVLLKQGGKVIKHPTQQLTGDTTPVTFDIAFLKEGTYRIEGTLLDKGKNDLATRNCALIKLSPRSGAVKIDRELVCVLKDDKPFFLLGIFIDYSYITAFIHKGLIKNFFDDVKRDSGFNHIVSIGLSEGNEGTSEKDILTFFDLCRDYGITTQYDVGHGYYRSSPFWLRPPTEEAKKQQITAGPEIRARMAKDILKYKDLPALLFYQAFDEGDAGNSPEWQKVYDLVKTRDPYHPVWQLFYRTIVSDKAYDVWATDRYFDGVTGTPLTIAATMDDNRVRVQEAFPEAVLKPMIMVPGIIWGQTPEQNRCQSYLALIHGAKGIAYYDFRPFSNLAWEGLKQLTRELNALGPIVLTPRVKQEVVSLTSFSPLQILVREYENDVYLICVNTVNEAINATIQVEGLDSRSVVKEMFEQKPVPVNAEKMTDTFAGFGSHVYTIRGLKKPRIYKITIAAEKQAREQVQGLKKARKGPPATSSTVNLLTNSSFEKTKADNLPNKVDVRWDPEWFYTFDKALVPRVDNTTSVDGYNSLLLQVPAEPAVAIPEMDETIELDSNKTYTFSVYMKADKDIPVVVRFGKKWAYVWVTPYDETVTVGKEWRRYVFKKKFDKWIVPNHMYYRNARGVMCICFQEKGAKLWVDAAQLEEGDKATVYTEDKYTRKYWEAQKKE